MAANRTYEFDGTSYNLVGDINTDNNTTYNAGTGITIGSGNKINHTNSITKGSAGGETTRTVGFSGQIKVPSVSYDSEGHITGASTATITLPANPNTDTKYKADEVSIHLDTVNSNTFSVKTVSTDLLTQGTNTLILDGSI